jgi:glycolate oxidase FAD binding subunit
MSATSNLMTRLESLLGVDRVLRSDDGLPDYAIDGIVPGAVVRPCCADEVVELARFAISEKLSIVPCGSRSKIDIGITPERYDIALDMTGLQSIAQHDAGDLTLAVDAGVSLRQLTELLEVNKQFLPLAAPCFETSTIGGTVASGIDSALRQQYGTARDFLTGAEFVDGKGQLCNSGGGVVKNVTGYDLHKLLIGSLGTLGVITRLNFRTFPMPEVSRGHLSNFASLQGALAYRQCLEASGLPLANLEVLSPETLSILCAILRRGDSPPPVSAPSEGWCVYAAFAGHEVVLARIASDLEQLAHGSGTVAQEFLDPSVDNNFGGMLRETYEWLRWAAPEVALFRIKMPHVEATTLEDLCELATSEALRHAVLVRAAAVAYLALMTESADDAALNALQRASARIVAAVNREKGRVKLLHAAAAVKKTLSALIRDGLDLEMEMRVKSTFDPQNIFAPGRIVGGV